MATNRDTSYTFSVCCPKERMLDTYKFKSQYWRYLLACLVFMAGLVLFYLSRPTFAPQINKPAAHHTRSGEGPASIPSFSVLLFTKTAGFRHNSIPDGIAAITALGQLHNFDVLTSEDAAVFTDKQLALHRVVIFLNTTGDILDEAQQAALERFIQNGGGFVGIHSATDTEYDWPWYGQLVGAYFASHPAIQSATVQVLEPDHPSTQPLPERWTRTDEWYNFQALPAPAVTILAEVDESTYSGGTMGSVHPIVWAHEFDGGRAWYTAMGHTSESYADPLFRQHLWGGILWAAGSQKIIYLPAIKEADSGLAGGQDLSAKAPILQERKR